MSLPCHLLRFVRDSARQAWIECDNDAADANAQAISDVNLSIAGTDRDAAEELIFQLISKWDNGGTKTPRMNYQPDEPGYEPAFEDDET